MRGEGATVDNGRAQRIWREIEHRLRVPMDTPFCPTCGLELPIAAYAEHPCYLAWREADMERRTAETQAQAARAVAVEDGIMTVTGETTRRTGLLLTLRVGVDAVTLATLDGPVLIVPGPGRERGRGWTRPVGLGQKVELRLLAPKSVRIERTRFGRDTAPAAAQGE